MATLHNQTDDGGSYGDPDDVDMGHRTTGFPMAGERIDPETGEIILTGSGFDDMADDDLGDAPVRPHHKGAPLPATGTYVEPCVKCNGTGRWSRPTSLGHHDCTRCHGTGKQTFRTSPDQRAQARKQRDARLLLRAKRAQERRAAAVAKWAAGYPGEHEWINKNAGRFDFATSMQDALGRFGKLTDGQLGAIQRCMARDVERAAERAAAPTVAPDAALPAVEDAFRRAKEQGIKWPKLLLDGFKLAPAGANSRNAGAIYVTQGDSRDGAYLGKVMGGKFLKSAACSLDLQASVLETLKDPLAAAVAYGRKFGRCSVCSRELSDPESIERGIGPICSERLFG